jgi:AcrR family transcriptional regulator
VSTEPQTRSRREPLSRDRVLRAAVELADAGGVAALSMRRLGQAVGVEAMSLYNHVANKEDLLDGMADRVVREIAAPKPGLAWRSALRRRATSMVDVLRRHPWASAVIESRRNPLASRMHACDTTIGVLRAAGFSPRLAYHAFLTLDSYVHGFALQEASWPVGKAELPEALARRRSELPAAEFPYIAEMMRFVQTESTAAEPTFDPEFEFGLDLILDGLDRRRAGE